MIIYNTFYGDGCECKDYIGSALTLNDAYGLIHSYYRFGDPMYDEEDQPCWMNLENPQHPDYVRFIVDGNQFESFSGWIGHYFTIEEYEIKE